MVEIEFKPNLCPNQEINIDELEYPLYASMKLDGIRCIIHPDLGIVSRSLKSIPNKQLNEKFKHILDYCKETRIILDGEIYAHNLTFQEISSHVMTKDKELNNNLKFYAFDCITRVPANETLTFNLRYEHLKNYADKCSSDIIVCTQALVRSPEDVKELFKVALNNNYEGLILKSPDGQYKFGRSTIKEATCFKVKPFIEKSAIIKGVVQSTAAIDGSERTINELGYSQTSNKKADRMAIERASAFVVDWNGLDLKLTIKATNAEKDDIWANRSQYIGCEVLFKAMDVGAKDLPRHPIALRWWLKNE